MHSLANGFPALASSAASSVKYCGTTKALKLETAPSLYSTAISWRCRRILSVASMSPVWLAYMSAKKEVLRFSCA